jgi:hypothetical protein
VSISIVKCSWVKCGDIVAKCCSVVVFFCAYGCTWFYVLYAFVYFCTLYILIVMFMYSYSYACSVLYPD